MMRAEPARVIADSGLMSFEVPKSMLSKGLIPLTRALCTVEESASLKYY